MHPRARGSQAYRGRQSVSRRVRDLLFAAVRLGDLGNDALLVEDDLVRQYAASRNAVREALQLLTVEGIVERQRRYGTRALGSGFISFSMDETTDIAPENTVYQRVIEERQVPVSGLLHRLLQLEPGETEVRMVENVFVAGEDVIGVRSAYYSTRFSSVAYGPQATLEGLRLFFGRTIGRVDTYLGACRVDESTARLLGINPEHAAIYRQQLFFDTEDQPVQLVFDHYRADRVVLHQLSPRRTQP